MILLDTHIWVWWVHGDTRLPMAVRDYVDGEESRGLGVNAISCWEVTLLYSRGRLRLALPCLDWLHSALATRGVTLLEITPEIAADGANLPGVFHRDPCDQLIVATARIVNCPLVTLDAKIRSYSHVKIAP